MIFQSRRRAALVLSLAPLIVASVLLATLGASAVAASQPNARPTRAGVEMPRALSAAARRREQSDRLLVSDAHALASCVSSNSRRPARCRPLRTAVQRAGRRLARAERRLAGVARSAPRAHSAVIAGRAPELTVSGDTLSWTQTAYVHTDVLESSIPGQAEQFSVVHSNSITPPSVPGATVDYRVRTASNSSPWSVWKSISYPSSEQSGEASQPGTHERQAAPVISVSGKTLTWNRVAGVNVYVLLTRSPGRPEEYSAVVGLSTTPAPVPGATVHYSVRTAFYASAWAPEVAISYTAAQSTPPPLHKEPAPGQEEPAPGQEELGQPPEPSGVIIGVVGGSGWGPEVAEKVIAAGFKSERLEAGGPYTTDQESYDNGFRNDTVIVGNTPDNEPLSTVNTASWVASALAQVKEAVAFDYTTLEVGNEMNGKGSQREPAKYAEMFMALYNAVNAAGIKGARLLFSGGGDYMRPGGTWSQITNGGGWVADAVKAQPGLLSAVGGFVEHPYGRAHEDNGEHAGPGGMEDQHANEVALGFKNTDIYITEYGVQFTPGSEGRYNASTEALQAQRIKEVYAEFLSLPYVRGIWYYQLHNDSTGNWGLVSGVWEPRPALAVLESYANGSA
jgi:hypothetical protein